jgi:hypothetical protein
MSEQECIDELKAKDWTRTVGGFKRGLWTIRSGPKGWELWVAEQCWAIEHTLAELLAATMIGSASITVASYFGLRAPGVV